MINAQADKVYECQLKAKDFHAELRLEDDKGRFIQQETFGDRNVSRLDFRCPMAATYHLIVRAMHLDEVGDFTLTIAERDKASAVSAAAPDTATLPAVTSKPFRLANGKATIDGTLTAGDPRDKDGSFFKAYPFTGAKGKLYRFKVVGKDGLVPFVRVEDQDGKRIKDEDSGEGNVSRVQFHAYAAGTYRVVATTLHAGATGAFTLTATEVDLKPATPIPLKLAGGTVRPGRIDPGRRRAPVGQQGVQGIHVRRQGWHDVPHRPA